MDGKPWHWVGPGLQGLLRSLQSLTCCQIVLGVIEEDSAPGVCPHPSMSSEKAPLLLGLLLRKPVWVSLTHLFLSLSTLEWRAGMAFTEGEGSRGPPHPCPQPLASIPSYSCSVEPLDPHLESRKQRSGPRGLAGKQGLGLCAS